MKKDKPVSDELRPNYMRADVGKLVRGKYAKRVLASSNIVVLNPDVARAFPNDEAVNNALLSLISVAKASTTGTN